MKSPTTKTDSMGKVHFVTNHAFTECGKKTTGFRGDLIPTTIHLPNVSCLACKRTGAFREAGK
jgi:hypothetical protein